MKRNFKRFVALTLTALMLSNVTAFANPVDQEELLTDFETSETVVEPLDEFDVDGLKLYEYNVEDPSKDLPEFPDLSDGLFLRNVGDNTSPDTAQEIELNTVISDGSITASGEQRWYKTIVPDLSRLTTVLTMPTNVDFDLYLFELDESTQTLYSVTYSESSMATERLDIIVNPGTYYIFVNGYYGVGDFELENYGASEYIDNEFNDTLSLATVTSTDNFAIQETISNPYDIDYFKTTFNTDKAVSFNISNAEGYVFLVITPDGNYYLIEDGSQALWDAGEYAFIVQSEAGDYDSINPYTFGFSTVPLYNKDQIIAYTADFRYFLQERTATDHYINDKKMDLTWHYSKNVISGTITMDVYDSYDYTLNGFTFGSYTSTWPDANCRDKDVIVFDIEDINFRVRGLHASEMFDRSRAQLVVDPETGYVIDCITPNYYYMYYSYTNRLVPFPAYVIN